MFWPSGWVCGRLVGASLPVTEPRIDILGEWRASQDARRSEISDFADYWLGLLGQGLLIFMLLYMMIGVAPYEHDTVLDPQTGVAPVSPWGRLVWLSLLALALPIFWFRRQVLAEAIGRIWPLIILLLWFSVTTLWALDPAVSSKRLVLFVIQALVCLGMTLSIRRGDRILAAMAIACAIMVAIDFFSWILAPTASMTEIGLAAIHTHKNTLGSVMMYCCLVSMAFLQGQKSFASRAFWISIILAGLALLVASKSKTSLGILVGTALAGPALIAVLRQRSSLIWAMVGASLAFVFILILAWLGWSALEGSDPLAPFSKVTFTMRTDIWRFVLGLWAEHPWKGVGFGSLWDVDPAVQPSLQTDEWFASPDAFTNESHNGYIDLLATTGVLGLFGALVMLVRWIWRALVLLRISMLSQRAQDSAVFPYAIYLGLFPLLFLLHNFLESSYFTANATFGILILLVGIDIDLRWPSRSLPGGFNVWRFGRS